MNRSDMASVPTLSRHSSTVSRGRVQPSKGRSKRDGLLRETFWIVPTYPIRSAGPSGRIQPPRTRTSPTPPPDDCPAPTAVHLLSPSAPFLPHQVQPETRFMPPPTKT